MDRRRGGLVLLTGLVFLALSLGVYQWVQSEQRDRMVSELDRSALIYRTLFQDRIHRYFGQINALQRFFDGSDEVDRSEFTAFVQPVLAGDPAIKSFVWVPRIPQGARAGFEQRSWETGLAGLGVYAFGHPEGVAVPGGGPDVFPLAYMEPLTPDLSGIGLDLSADPTGDDTLKKVARSGEPHILTDMKGFPGLSELYENTSHLTAIIEPVYDRDGVVQYIDGEERQKHLKGYLILLFDLGLSFEDSISGTSAGGIDIVLNDLRSGATPSPLYHHASRAKGAGSTLFSGYQQREALQSRTVVGIRSVNWELVFSPVLKFYQRHYQWQAELALVLGLMLTAVAMFFVHSGIRKFRLIEDVVDVRTRSLEASRRDQISTLESISDIFFTVDSDWRIIYANPKAEELLGKINEDLTGKNLWDEVPEFGSFFYRPLYRAMKGKKSQHDPLLPYPPLNKWFMLKAYPYQGGLSVYLLDATDRIKERNERERIERHTQAILETAVDGIITINDRGIIETINPAAQAIFGYRENDVIGKNVSMLMPEPDRSQHDGYLHNHIRLGAQKIIGIGREVVGMRANGEQFPMSLAVSRMDTGETISFAGIIRDITEQRAALQQVIEAKEAAEVANKAKTSFLNSMGHELRTPLNAVIGFSQMLALDPKSVLSEKQREYIEDITTSGELLLELVSQVLDLSSIEAGRLDLSISQLDARDIVHECISITRAMAEKKNVTIIDQVSEGDALVIRTDAMRLKQVLLNLVSNAIKYNHDGGHVTLSAEPVAGGALRIYVADTGPGIPENKRDRIFEPFDRLGREALSIEGTGIGLTIVSHLMEVLGGRVGLTSDVGVGSTFWIELPLNPADQS